MHISCSVLSLCMFAAPCVGQFVDTCTGRRRYSREILARFNGHLGVCLCTRRVEDSLVRFFFNPIEDAPWTEEEIEIRD